jgi:hypothetical protein
MIIVPPKYKSKGEDGNYSAGYVGFSYKDNSIVSFSISIFTRMEYEFGVVPSHAFYVVDEKSIIEATGLGVRFTQIEHYFEDPHYIVFFRKPRNLNPYKVAVMTDWLFKQVGKEYDFKLLASFFIWIESLPFLRKYPSIFNTPSNFLCSELVAEALNKIPEFSAAPPLSTYHTSKITPNQLFHSESIFEPWKFDEWGGAGAIGEKHILL